MVGKTTEITYSNHQPVAPGRGTHCDARCGAECPPSAQCCCRGAAGPQPGAGTWCRTVLAVSDAAWPQGCAGPAVTLAAPQHGRPSQELLLAGTNGAGPSRALLRHGQSPRPLPHFSPPSKDGVGDGAGSDQQRRGFHGSPPGAPGFLSWAGGDGGRRDVGGGWLTAQRLTRGCTAGPDRNTRMWGAKPAWPALPSPGIEPKWADWDVAELRRPGPSPELCPGPGLGECDRDEEELGGPAAGPGQASGTQGSV